MRSEDKQSLKHYPYAACRSIGHAWDIFEWRNPMRGEVACTVVLTLKCLRCEGHRTDWLGSVGQVLYRVYEMAPDYYWTDKDTRPERFEYREQWMKKTRPRRPRNVININEGENGVA